jgi:hypothetical protein
LHDGDVIGCAAVHQVDSIGGGGLVQADRLATLSA